MDATLGFQGTNPSDAALARAAARIACRILCSSEKAVNGNGKSPGSIVSLPLCTLFTNSQTIDFLPNGVTTSVSVSGEKFVGQSWSAEATTRRRDVASNIPSYSFADHDVGESGSRFVSGEGKVLTSQTRSCPVPVQASSGQNQTYGHGLSNVERREYMWPADSVETVCIPPGTPRTKSPLKNPWIAVIAGVAGANQPEVTRPSLHQQAHPLSEGESNSRRTTSVESTSTIVAPLRYGARGINDFFAFPGGYASNVAAGSQRNQDTRSGACSPVGYPDSLLRASLLYGPASSSLAPHDVTRMQSSPSPATCRPQVPRIEVPQQMPFSVSAAKTSSRTLPHSYRARQDPSPLQRGQERQQTGTIRDGSLDARSPRIRAVSVPQGHSYAQQLSNSGQLSDNFAFGGGSLVLRPGVLSDRPSAGGSVKLQVGGTSRMSTTPRGGSCNLRPGSMAVSVGFSSSSAFKGSFTARPSHFFLPSSIPGIHPVPGSDYVGDPSDPLDRTLSRCLLALGRDASARLMLRRRKVGKYDIDGRQVSLIWSGQPHSPAVRVKEDDVADSSEMPLLAYLSQAANVVASLSGANAGLPAVTRIPLEMRLTFAERSNLTKTLDIEDGHIERVDSMKLACEQARMREFAARASSFDYASLSRNSFAIEAVG